MISRLKRTRLLQGFLAIFALLLVGSCSNDLDVNAPPKDVYVVYGILNPKNEVQSIRIARAFQTESDALAYAKENDLSVKGLSVRLRYQPRGGGPERVIELEETDTVRESSQFASSLTVYQTREPIEQGATYFLEVRRPGEESLIVKSKTTVPGDPYLFRPSPDTINNIDTDVRGNVASYPLALLTSNQYFIQFEKAASGVPQGAAYEMRFFLKYSETPGGPEKELVIGPTAFFSNSNIACQGIISDRVICYRFGMSVQNNLNSRFRNGKFYYDESLMSKAARLEITAVDEGLYNYIRVNSPAFVDFTTVRPEYTNIEGGLGVFGSANSDSRYVRLNQCSKYLANLNDTPAPETQCP